MSRTTLWQAGLFAAIALSGCATGSTIHSQGTGNTNTIGNTSNNVDWRLVLSASVGDKVAEEAAKAIKDIMAPGGGIAAALTPDQKKQAVDVAVAAGVKQVQAEGGKLTEEKTAAITQRATEAVEAEAKKAAEGAAPATP